MSKVTCATHEGIHDLTESCSAYMSARTRNQPDEPQDDEQRKWSEFRNNNLCGFGDCEKPALLIRAAQLKSQFAAAAAVHHAQAKSLLVLADTNMKIAMERDRLARQIDCGLFGERDGCLSGERVCLLCQLADLRKAKTEADKENYTLHAECDTLNEKATEYRDLATGLEAEVEQLTDDKAQVIADSFAAQKQLSRALVEKKQQADIAEMFSDWWHELISATGAGLHLSTVKAQHKATLKWIQDARRQRHAAAEAVKQKAVEIADSEVRYVEESFHVEQDYAAGRLQQAKIIRQLLTCIDVAALVGAAQEDDNGNV